MLQLGRLTSKPTPISTKLNTDRTTSSTAPIHGPCIHGPWEGVRHRPQETLQQAHSWPSSTYYYVLSKQLKAGLAIVDWFFLPNDVEYKEAKLYVPAVWYSKVAHYYLQSLCITTFLSYSVYHFSILPPSEEYNSKSARFSRASLKNRKRNLANYAVSRQRD